MATVSFEYEVEVQATDESGEVYTDYVAKTFTVDYSVEPAQRGGWDDPSWNAYPFIDGGVTDEDGNGVDDPDIIEAAERAMEADFRSGDY